MLFRYLDPKNDLAFKKVFGQEKHKRIPIAFLNAVFNLEGPDEITDLEFLNTLQPPEIEARKESIVDVLVRDQKGSKYIVEMQVAKIEGFEKRAQFYAAKTYCTHFNAGNPYEDLNKVIFLAITSYTVFPGKEHYKSDHVILDNRTYENDLKDFYFTFVELPKFTKGIHELETLEDKWYYFLKHAEESKEIDISLASNAEINEAYHVLDKTFWSEPELHEYERVAMSIADAKGAIVAARKEGLQEGLQEGLEKGLQEGLEKGLQEGLEKGLQQGLEKGLQEGLEKGRQEERLVLAVHLINKQFSINQVAELTGLPIDVLRSLT
jgi:predicted transposase/invertase (TIGR01784 family)